MSLNRPVLATYLSTSFIPSLSLSRNRRSFDFRFSFLASMARSCLKVRHSRRKCDTVSFAAPHDAHMGDSTYFMVWRCLASGACPERSLMSVLVCARVKSLVAFRKAGEGRFGSIFVIFPYRGDLLHFSFHCSCDFCRYACLSAEEFCAR